MGHRRGAEDQHRVGEVNTETRRITRPPVRSLTRALDHLDYAGLCCRVVAPAWRRCRRWSRVNGPDLGELDGRGAMFVLPVVSEADSPPRAQEGIVCRLVALIGPVQRCLCARVEQAARMQRLAWLRPAPVVDPGGGDWG